MQPYLARLDGRTTVTKMQLLVRRIFEENNGLDPTVILVTHDVREAVFLATDILIMGGKPSHITHHLEIDLPDVRTADTKKLPQYIDYTEQVEDITNNMKKIIKKVSTYETKNQIFCIPDRTAVRIRSPVDDQPLLRGGDILAWA